MSEREDINLQSSGSGRRLLALFALGMAAGAVVFWLVEDVRIFGSVA